MDRFLILFMSAFLFSACQTAAVPPQTGVREEIAKIPPPEDEAPIPVDEAAPASMRFCQDDIYSQHLSQSFLSQQPKTAQDRRSQQVQLQMAQQEAFKKLRYQLPLEFAGLPVKASPRVLSWIYYFSGRGRSDFLLWLIRSSSFQEVVAPLLQQEGLPPEFFFLAMIESGFSNEAFSRAAAAGTWQFMTPTARHYGLRVDHWVDERRDPVKSTLAAARYLKDLHQQFGDWYLALAAYNAGPTRVINAIRKAKSRDYWVISKGNYLRPETINYVPKLLAAIIIASHPSNFGFDVAADMRNKTPTSSLELVHSYRLEEIALKLGIPLADLKKWNPELVQGITPPLNPINRKSYRLRLPRTLQMQLASHEPELERLVIEDVLQHKIRKGETLARIARLYKVSVQKILNSNPHLNPKNLKLGSTVAVPIPFIVGSKQAALEKDLSH